MSESAVPVSEYQLHVDSLSFDRMEGWAQRIGDTGHRPDLSLLVNGKWVGACVCANLRPDVREAGIGDGKYGFSLELMEAIDPARDTLHIVLDQSAVFALTIGGGRAQIAPASSAPMEEPAHAAPALAGTGAAACAKTTLYLDVSDLFFYWQHHRAVSGIQRVQLGFVRNLLAGDPEDFRVVFCLKRIPELVFHAVHRGELERMLDLNQSEDCSDQQWWNSLTAFVTTNRPPLQFEANSTIAVLGAPWVSPEYYEVFAKIKNETGLRIIQLLYDLIPMRRPDLCDASLAHCFTEFIIQAFSIGDAFLTISEYTKLDSERAMTELGVPPKPIRVIPMGTELTPTGRVDRPKGVNPAVRTLLRQDYVLFVSTVEARKNHRFIADLWRELIARLGAGNTPKLVWVGRRGWLVDDLFKQMEANRWLDGQIVHLQNVSDHELELLYEHCQFTVFPSSCEGWGLPVTESLRYGKPCVITRTASLPEAGGPYATYIDINDNRQALDTVTELITNTAWRQALAEKIANEFTVVTWAAATGALLEALRDLSGPITTSERLSIAFSEGDVPFIADCIPVFPLGRDIATGCGDGRLPATVDRSTTLKRYMYFGGDWHGVEPDLRWAKGPNARLLFAVHSEPAIPLVLYLGVCLPSYYGTVDVAFYVGGRFKGAVPTSGREHVRLTLDASDLLHTGGRAFVALDIMVTRTILPPADHPDTRHLGPGLTGLMICRSDDMEARLSQLERLAGLRTLVRDPDGAGAPPTSSF